MKNLTIRINILLILFVVSVSSFSQIHSTSSGGPWDDVNTWIGTVVPGSGHDVVINGTVNCYTGSPACNNITVSSSGTLQNDWYGGTLVVHGNITNSGTIQNYSSAFTLYIKGNITNNGTWVNSYTQINGTTGQTVSCLGGNVFAGSQFLIDKTTGGFFFDGIIGFENCDVFLGSYDVYLQSNSTLSVHDGRFLNGNIIGSGATSIVNGVGTYNLDAPEFNNIDFNDLTLDGEINLYAGCTSHGTVTNEGVLSNSWYSTILYCYDDFINNGTIQNYSSYLTIRCYGNFTNNAVIENQAMDFYGDTDQNITLLTGEEFSPTFLTSFKPSGSIIAQTDLKFTNTAINMVDDALVFQDGGTLLMSGGYMTNATIYDTDSPNGYLHLNFTNEAYIVNSTVTNPELLGKVDIANANTFIGDILVTDTMQNDWYGYTLNVDGNIINNGVIQNYSSALTINISGNVTNNGIWQNSHTYLNGTTDQHVTCLNDKWFTGYQFDVTNTDASIYLDAEVGFHNTRVHFQNNTAELPAGSTLLLHGSYLYQCNLHGNGETSIVHGEGEFYVDGPHMQNTTLEDISLTGDWGFATGNVFNGTIINDGRMQNNYYGYFIDVYADFINNGTIRSYSSGFTMKMYGNFTNNGIWNGNAIDFYGDTDQEITLDEGQTFSPTYFTSFKPSGNIVALTDLSFNNTIVNLENDPLIMPDNSSLSINYQRLYRANVSAETDRFNLFTSNEAYLHECTFTNVNLIGTTDVNNLNNFYGTTINYGLMQNDYYGYTANFYGDLINNGTIQNYSSAFTVNAHANIVNNGDWNNTFTQMVGTIDQTVTIKNGHSITGQMRFVSDVLATPYQWYWGTWPIENAPYPTPAIISGETSSTLTWISPVNSSWLGTYKCWAGGTYSRNIFIEECNSTMDIAPLALDFGSQEVTPGTDVLSINIANNGDCELEVEKLYLTGLEPPFSTAINEIDHLIVIPGESYEIPVSLNTEYLPGIYNDQLILSPYNMDKTDLTLGLVAYYPFNGNTNDESGNANHGLAKNGAMLTADRFGNANSAYSFDGADDYIEILDATSLRPVDVSLSAWFNFSSVTGDIKSLIGKTVGSSWQDSYTMWRHNSMKGAIGNDGQFDEIIYNNSTVQDVWYHIAYTYNDANDVHSLYINGQLVITESNSVSIGYDSHPLLIGADIEVEVLSYFFHGLIDDVRIYNRAISADEVYELYYENQQNPDIVTITVQAELTHIPDVAITAFFEGPFNGTNMNANLNSILPLAQPYNTYPWGYDGGESVPSIPNADVIDWLLVEYRDAPDAESATSTTSLGGQAAFILRDGSIVDLDGSSPLVFDYTVNGELFVLLWHRNHLPVMSAFPVASLGGDYTYNFTTAATQAYGDNQSNLGAGYYGLIAGDANADGTVNENDGIEAWIMQAGHAGYFGGDVNMDTQVNNQDKNDIWLPNYGKSEILPQ